MLVSDRADQDPRSGVRLIVKSPDAARLAEFFTSDYAHWLAQDLVASNGYTLNFDADMIDEWVDPGGRGAHAYVTGQRFSFMGDVPRHVAGQIAGVLTGSLCEPVPMLLACWDADADNYLWDADGDKQLQIPVCLVPEATQPVNVPR